MPGPYPSYRQVLANIKHGTRTLESSTEGYTHITQIASTVGLSVTVTLTRYGPNYYAYPNWSTTGLASWWTLASTETIAGTGGVRDSHGSTNGTIAGNPAAGSYEDVDAGIKRRFLVFDGTGDYVDLGDITALDSAAAWSIGMRFRPDAATAQPLLGRYPSSNTNKQFLVEITSDATIKFTYATNASGGVATVETAGVLTADTWYNMLITHNTSSSPRTNIYINDVDQTLTTEAQFRQRSEACLATSILHVMKQAVLSIVVTCMTLLTGVQQNCHQHRRQHGIQMPERIGSWQGIVEYQVIL